MDSAWQEEKEEGRKEKSFLTFSAFYEIMYIETMAKGATMQFDTGWKKEMDKLYEKTAKNWWKTGTTKKVTKSKANTNLGRGKQSS